MLLEKLILSYTVISVGASSDQLIRRIALRAMTTFAVLQLLPLRYGRVVGYRFSSVASISTMPWRYFAKSQLPAPREV